MARRGMRLLVCGALVGALASSHAEAQLRPIVSGRLPSIHRDGGGGPARCAWPYVVDVDTQNLAYPDPNATYWAIPLQLAADESLVLHGEYPSARFMAVTLYTATGDLITQLSDLDIAPDPGSANPYAVADPPPGSGRRWSLAIVPSGTQSTSANVLELEPGQRTGWVLYRVYLGNPSGDLQGSAPLPTVVHKRSGKTTGTLEPCTKFLPGDAVTDILKAAMPDPVLVTAPPQLVRIDSTSGLFANAANAYLIAYADAKPGEILVVRGKLPTTPDTELGESVVGNFQMRYFSITSNLNEKPYPVVDGIYGNQLPFDEAGFYTVVVARDADVPWESSEIFALLAWGDGDSEAVIVRNMLPASSFTHAVQDVTPSAYGAPSDAAEVMGEFYPRIVACQKVVFETHGADGCFATAP